MLARGRPVALVVCIAAALRLILGPGAIGYDAAWALEWGREAMAGRLPSFDAVGAPTPHPLANVVSAVLAPLGTRAGSVVMAVSWLSLAALAYFAFCLGRRLFAVWVGLLFALLLVTRELLVRETQQAFVDVPFVALVLAALVVESQRPRSALRVAVLLAAASLLRPEGWLLGVAWLAWAAPSEPRATTVRAGLVIAASPLLWCLQDLIVVGDPFYSLNATRDLAADLGRPTEAGTALAAVPKYLRSTVGTSEYWVGLAGAAASLAVMPRRAVLPAAAMAVALLAFLALGVAGLPLLTRYLLLPASLLLLFAAVAALGWTVREEAGRGWWIAGGVVATAVLAAAVPGQVRALHDLRERTAPRVTAYEDLRRLVEQPDVRAAAARCGPLFVPDRGLQPLLAAWLERAPATLPIDGDGPRGSFLAYANEDAAQAFGAQPRPLPPGRLPSGSEPVAANGSWLFGVRC